MAPWQPTAATMKEPKVSVMYVGDPSSKGDGPDVIESWGFTFPKGEAVEVPESLAARLGRSDHWRVGNTDAVDTAHSDDKSIDKMNAADLRALCDERGIDHAGMSKAQMRDALQVPA